jgi:hippurate hydrolase
VTVALASAITSRARHVIRANHGNRASWNEECRRSAEGRLARWSAHGLPPRNAAAGSFGTEWNGPLVFWYVGGTDTEIYRRA